jgi:indolepyruvate ferredoxin oxidoreductase beta subunit
MNCLITGVGGQGTVLLSRLIGEAAIAKGMDVRGSETIGMAQRGGSVVSHLRMASLLRMGPGMFSPLIPPGKADLIIAFECAEAVRVLPFLSPAGKLLVLDREVAPVASSLGGGYDPAAMIAYLQTRLGERLTVVSWEQLIEHCGNPRVANVALLGKAIAGGLLPFSTEEIIAVLKRRIPAKYLEMNIRALGAYRGGTR